MLFLLQNIVHYGLHIFLPGLYARIFYRKIWMKAWIIMFSTMLVDLDHLFAQPIFDPQRCSIGFHPLHSYVAIGIYVLGLFHRKTRMIAVGLLLHMATDGLDCLWLRFITLS